MCMGGKGVRMRRVGMHMVPVNNTVRVQTELRSQGTESRDTQQRWDTSCVRYSAR